MLTYPSINSIGRSTISKGTSCHAFIKYDGSNIRFEWSSKKGFHKFGSRHQLIERTTPVLGESVELIQDEVGPKLLSDLLNFDKKLINNAGAFTGFAEFFGENSFAGTHQDEAHLLKVFDVSIYKKGFMNPQSFLNISLGHPEIYAAYLGQLAYNDSLVEQCYTGELLATLDVLQKIPEGVVLKIFQKNQVQRLKLKTKIWLDSIKNSFENWEDLV